MLLRFLTGGVLFLQELDWFCSGGRGSGNHSTDPGLFKHSSRMVQETAVHFSGCRLYLNSEIIPKSRRPRDQNDCGY